jgi:hypothetical protein
VFPARYEMDLYIKICHVFLKCNKIVNNGVCLVA